MKVSIRHLIKTCRSSELCVSWFHFRLTSTGAWFYISMAPTSEKALWKEREGKGKEEGRSNTMTSCYSLFDIAPITYHLGTTVKISFHFLTSTALKFILKGRERNSNLPYKKNVLMLDFFFVLLFSLCCYDQFPPEPGTTTYPGESIYPPASLASFLLCLRSLLFVQLSKFAAWVSSFIPSTSRQLLQFCFFSARFYSKYEKRSFLKRTVKKKKKL